MILICRSWKKDTPTKWLTCVVSRELHGITDRGNPAVTAVNTGVMGAGSNFYRGSGGNGNIHLEISIDYRGNTAVTAVMGTISVILLR